MLGLVAPRDEGGKSTRFVLQRTEAKQMFDAFRIGLDRAVHHGRRGAKTRAMRVPHHIEPFVGGRLPTTMQKPAHTVDQDLSAAARYAVQPGGHQPLDDDRHPQLREAREVDHFWR